MISKKDFVELATILGTTETRDQIINSVVQYCKSANPRFSESKFRTHIQKLRD